MSDQKQQIVGKYSTEWLSLKDIKEKFAAHEEWRKAYAAYVKQKRN